MTYDHQNISRNWVWSNYFNTQKCALFSKIRPPQIYWYWNITQKARYKFLTYCNHSVQHDIRYNDAQHLTWDTSFIVEVISSLLKITGVMLLDAENSNYSNFFFFFFKL